jgi:glc operon protein GlcG
MTYRHTLMRVVPAFIALAIAASAQAQTAPAQITLAEARRVAETAQQAAVSMKLNVTIAVVDTRGDLVALLRLPGSGVNTPDTAIGKAMVSAVYGQPSSASIARATNPTTQAWNDASGGRLRYLQGGVPIVRGGLVIGAVAVSGATAQQDEDIAKAGLAALAK